MDEVEEVERKRKVGASCGHHTHTHTLNVSQLHTWFRSVRSLCALGKQLIMDDSEC